MDFGGLSESRLGPILSLEIAHEYSDASPARAGGQPNRRPRRTPKGRQVDPQALEEVCALLGATPRRRDLLIEHLHLIQDAYGVSWPRISPRSPPK